MPPHELKLKPGSHCYIVRNISPEDGLLNNTRVEVLSINKSMLNVRIIETDKTFCIHRISFSIELKKNKVKFIRKQFPLRLCYATTVNRSQGATLHRGGLDIRTPPFGHGQLAVALTRFQTRDDLIILANQSDLTPDGFAQTKNIVYTELLS